MTAGRGLKKRRVGSDGLLAPELMGSRFGSLKIVSRVVLDSASNLRVEVACDRCGMRHFGLFHNLRKRPDTAACPHCNARRPVLVPKWLYERCQAQLSRCTNQNDSAFDRYGGRGIEFRFSSANEAAHWIAANLGVPDRSMQLDRVDNNGHYEPGNLRWSTAVGNQNNTRVSGGRQRFIAFRKAFPGVRYADKTLVNLLRSLTPEEIAERWKEHSHKPKGKYGTCSMQGPYRGSLPTDG
jgi:hypothetical protein